MKLSQEQRDECVQIRKDEKKKRSGEKLESEYTKKIAVLEAKIQDQELKIASITSNEGENEKYPSFLPNRKKAIETTHRFHS